MNLRRSRPNIVLTKNGPTSNGRKMENIKTTLELATRASNSNGHSHIRTWWSPAGKRGNANMVRIK